MITFEAVIRTVGGVRATELRAWIEEGWVRPEQLRGVLVFREIDVARVRLIHDLRRELAIGDDAVPVVLNLLDQLYAMRRRLRLVSAAVAAQPPAVRRSLRGALGASRRRSPKPARKKPN